MVPAQVEQVCRRDLHRVGEQGLPQRRRLRRRDRGFQPRLVPQSRRSSVGREHFPVHRLDGGHRRVHERRRQDSRRNKSVFVRISRFAVSAARSGPMAGR